MRGLQPDPVVRFDRQPVGRDLRLRRLGREREQHGQDRGDAGHEAICTTLRIIHARFTGGAVPLYEYECKKCHFRFERIQLFSDPLVRKCPKCKTGRVEKLLSAPA
ncbi:MAG TPA: zinc ribbon domain-containing protein, partial [Candidatus Polarisedimenticolia bacterium]|nr:zinc ribbon domain-containing protein [Candidatus Polarisedimenticolia bacterium]